MGLDLTSFQLRYRGERSYLIDHKLVTSVALNALIDLSASDRVFREKGEYAY